MTPSFIARQRHRLALAHQHFNLPQFPNDLLRRERFLWQGPVPFCLPVSRFDWYRKPRSGHGRGGSKYLDLFLHVVLLLVIGCLI